MWSHWSREVVWRCLLPAEKQQVHPLVMTVMESAQPCSGEGAPAGGRSMGQKTVSADMTQALTGD
jgi:hypothetical protein